MKNILQPIISVIVPIYNTEPYLKKCVDSILNQTYNNLEVFLVDDGSTDKCPQICDEYQAKDKRIRVIHKENGGVSDARNAALDMSNGEYIAFIDADDYIAPDYFANLIIYDADLIISGTNIPEGLYSATQIIDNYHSLKGLSGPCEKLYKRSVVKDIRYRKEIKIGEDIIYNLEVLEKVNTVFYTAYKGYYITNNPDSLTRTQLGKYDYKLDEEYQNQWGEIHSAALLKAGISQKSTDAANTKGCSIWIYQKIKNYTYNDCPLPYNEKIKRIKKQLVANKDKVLSTKTPISPKTYKLVKLCININNPHITYLIFKILTILGL